MTPRFSKSSILSNITTLTNLLGTIVLFFRKTSVRTVATLIIPTDYNPASEIIQYCCRLEELVRPEL
jgi:hypothetical protein